MSCHLRMYVSYVCMYVCMYRTKYVRMYVSYVSSYYIFSSCPSPSCRYSPHLTPSSYPLILPPSSYPPSSYPLILPTSSYPLILPQISPLPSVPRAGFPETDRQACVLLEHNLATYTRWLSNQEHGNDVDEQALLDALAALQTTDPAELRRLEAENEVRGGVCVQGWGDLGSI